MNRRTNVREYQRDNQTVQAHTRRVQPRADIELVARPGGYDVVRQPAPIVGPESWEMPARAVPPSTSAHVEGSYTDRAKGFSISTWQLSAITGLVAWIMGGVGGTALLSLAGLAWLVVGFFVVWLVAYAMHVFVSAEGTEFFRAAGEYRLLREEQKERHRRMKGGR